MRTSQFLKIGLLVIGLAFTSQPAEAQLGKLVKKAKEKVSNTVKKGKEAINDAVTPLPKEVECVFSNVKGVFSIKTNSITFFSEGRRGGTTITLNNDGSITDNNGNALGKIGDDGFMIEYETNHKAKIDPKTHFVYNDKGVIGTLEKRKVNDKEMLSFVIYNVFYGDGLYGDAQQLKRIDLRLPVWTAYCYLLDSNVKDDQVDQKIQEAIEKQKVWDSGSQSDVSRDMIDQIEYALQRQGDLTINGETGKVVQVNTAEKTWNYLRKETPPYRPNSRYMNMWVLIKFDSYYLYRKYLIEQVYKGGNETSDASYAAVTRPRPCTWEGVVIENLYPVYK